MALNRFHDNDEAYEDWLKHNQHGYVINIRRGTKPPMLHTARCMHLAKFHRSTLTEKICDVDRQALEEWARHKGRTLVPCSSCDA
jgi:hypothetical protein